MDSTLHRKPRKKPAVWLLLIVLFLLILGVLFFIYSARENNNKQQALQIKPPNQRDNPTVQPRIFFVNVPEELDQLTKTNIRINQWTYSEKESGLQIHIIVLPYGIDYAKKTYPQLAFKDYTNTVLRGWHNNDQDQYDMYILEKDIATRVWITSDISKISDKSHARNLTRQVADSIRFKN